MDLEFDHKEQLSDDVFTFYFKTNPEFRFIAGQFCEVTIHSQNHADTKRWFSLSSAPSEDLIAITTKLPEITSDFKSSLLGLEPSDPVHFSAPLGNFVLPKLASIPLVFIAGGLGCTPYRSIIKELKLTGQTRDITLYISYRSESAGIFEDVFGELNDNYQPIFSGKLDIPHIVTSTESLKQAYFYVAGPEDMVTETKAQLLNLEIPANHIFIDNFIGYTEPSQ